MGRALAIVSGQWNSSQLTEAIPPNTDVLAFDLPAMQACRFSRIRFLTPNDFYPPDQFRLSFRQILDELEGLFEDADRKYASEIKYPHSLKSNMYPFACYFADLHYLRGLARAIKQRTLGQRIIMVGSQNNALEGVRVPTCDILDDELFTKRDASIYNLTHLSKLLDAPPLMQAPQSQYNWLERSALVHVYHRYAYLLRPVSWGMLLERLRTRFNASVNAHRGRRVIWCIQDGYDVAALKKYMPDFRFLNPMRSLLEKANDFPVNGIRPIYQETVQALGELYPEWTSEIATLIEKYHEGVVCRLAPVAERIAEQVETDQPQCALYSIGAVIPLEALYAWVLNKYNVPIYAFQHGGSNFYFNSPLNKYIEFNTEADQRTFCVSRIETDLRRQENPQLRAIWTGSIKLFERHEDIRKRTQTAGNGRVLYVQGRYPSEAWKNLFCSEGEDVVFAKHEQLFDLASKYALLLDIKLFPGTGKLYAPYFRRFVRSSGIQGVRLLYAVPAEVVAPHYSLIITEYIGSALNAFFMALDRPIVYYLLERDVVNLAVAEDVYQRHYVAHNGTDLDELLQRYKQGRLPSKYSPEFVDKYAYPLNAENPGIRIAGILEQGMSCRSAG